MKPSIFGGCGFCAEVSFRSAWFECVIGFGDFNVILETVSAFSVEEYIFMKCLRSSCVDAVEVIIVNERFLGIFSAFRLLIAVSSLFYLPIEFCGEYSVFLLDFSCS